MKDLAINDDYLHLAVAAAALDEVCALYRVLARAFNSATR